jgi:hypothetical protein
VLAFPLIAGGDVYEVDVFPVMPMNSIKLDMIPKGTVWVLSISPALISDVETYLA